MRIEISNIKKFNNMLFSRYKIKNKAKITGLTIDSRLIQNGDLFIPLKGEKANGHDFINDAIKSGASLILSENQADIQSKKITYVKSTYNTLKEISMHWRKCFSGNIIGITGSNGKTTTKEILGSILSNNMKCNYSKGNYNSTTGVPLSIIAMDTDADNYIFELGMSKPGEIKKLCNISKPNIGLITNISGAHIEFFKSLDNIAKEKSSLFLSLSNKDIAFVNIDDPYIKKIPTNANKITYSLKQNANYSGKLIIDANGQNNLKINNTISIKLPYGSKAFAYNALAAFSISDFLGVNKNVIIENIEKFKNLIGRNNIYNHNGYTIIDDTYNSNLESAKSGILDLDKYSLKHRCIAVISDMLELGDKGIPYHKELGNIISKTNIHSVFGIGQLTEKTISTLNKSSINTFYFDKKEDLSNNLSKFIKKGDVIYFKASRGMKLEKIINEVFG